MTITQEELEKARLREEQPSPGSPGRQAADWDGHAGSLALERPVQGSRGIAGVSEETLQGLRLYSQPYAPSAEVEEAQAYLQSVAGSAPAYSGSPYSGQIASLYDQIMNRPAFSYNVNTDPLFRQYKNQYTVNGQRAMQDAIGSAAALTGGYGNSWGTTAGFQAYQYYLQQLSSVIPELEARAYSRYMDEDGTLRRNLELARTMDNADYGRYRDTVSDWKSTVSAAKSAYSTASGSDLSMWKTMQAYYKDLADMEADSYWHQQDDLYRWGKLQEEQRQYDATLAENQRRYDTDLAENRRRYDTDLAENRRQFDTKLAYQFYSDGLDEAYRRDTLAQSQSQWEAEQGLNQAKFDFQVRQYEEALQQALAGSVGSGQGYVPAVKQEDKRTAESLVTPVIPQVPGGGPLAQTAPAIPLSQWEQMQRGMDSLYQSSVEKKNRDTAKLKANAALTGIPNGNLAVAALNAAQKGVIKNSVKKGK